MYNDVVEEAFCIFHSSTTHKDLNSVIKLKIMSHKKTKIRKLLYLLSCLL